MKRIEERTAVSEKRALNQLLGQNRFLTEQLSNLSKRVIDGEKRHKDGELWKLGDKLGLESELFED